jgi:hypothetical protein
MAIVYTLVCRGETTLCDYNQGTGNYPTILHQFVCSTVGQAKVSSNYPNSNYLLHVLRDAHLSFSCLADGSLSTGTVFQYLEELRERFQRVFQPEEVGVASTYSLQNRFIDHIREVEAGYKSKSVEKLNAINSKLNQTKEFVITSYDKLVSRADSLDLIVQRAQSLDELSKNCKELASVAQKEAYWRNQKCKIAGLGGAAAGILLLIVFVL